MAATVATKVPFYQLALLLDKINKTDGKDRKKKVMKDFIDEWRSFHTKLHDSDGDTLDSIFPAMRLLLPHLDRSREAYGIKENTLAKLYIEILGLGKDSPSAQKLINFRAPKTAKSEAGDFAAIAYLILKPRCPDKGSLTVAEVNAYLDDVASGNASKNKAKVRLALGQLLRQLSAREQKWLIRMIMKDLKIGLNQESILDIYHADASDLYNVKMNLEKVCVMLKDPSTRLHEIEISLFGPFRPMLGDRITPQTVDKIWKCPTFFVEIKYDGERMQLHKRGNEFKYFSRSGNEYTSTYGAFRTEGNLTPFIANCFKPSVDSCILDGEMVGYNPQTKTIGSKGENFDIKSRDVAVNGYQPMLCVFDVLLFNGDVLANRSLRERKRLLVNDIFNPVEGRIALSEHKEMSSKLECIEALNDAIDKCEEGIMLKDPQSVYKPAARTGGWYKMKPEYVGGLMDELDILVVGGYFGIGSRSHMISHFLCAVAVPARSGEHPSIFQSFCRVGSGYTKKELFEFNRQLAPHWKAFDKKSLPAWLELAPGLKQRPDVYIDPEKSAILQVKAAEIIESDQYRTKCTLRFPRVEKIRNDKAWHSCLTVAELEDLKLKSSGKLVGQRADFASADDEPKKKRPRLVHSVKPTVMSRFCGINTGNLTQTSEILSGKEFCVMISDNVSGMSKADVERKIVESGGTFVQNPGSSTYCIIADKMSLKVKNAIKKGCYDVVSVNWLIRCLEQQELTKWLPGDMIHTSSATAVGFTSDFDCYGDSYFDDTNPEQLEKTFDKIPAEDLKAVDNKVIADFEEKYFPHDSVSGLFRLCRVYMYDGAPNLISMLLKLHGATVVQSLDEHVSHVIIDYSDVDQLPRLRRILNRSRSAHFHAVMPSWVTESIASGKILQERQYRPQQTE